MVPPYRGSFPSTDSFAQLTQLTFKLVTSKAKTRDRGPAVAFDLQLVYTSRPPVPPPGAVFAELLGEIGRHARQAP